MAHVTDLRHDELRSVAHGEFTDAATDVDDSRPDPSGTAPLRSLAPLLRDEPCLLYTSDAADDPTLV